MATARLKQLVAGELRESHDSTSNGMSATLAASISAKASSGIAAALANRSSGTPEATRQSKGAAEGAMLLGLLQGDPSKSVGSNNGPTGSTAKVWEMDSVEARLAAGTAQPSSVGKRRERRLEKTFSEEERSWRNRFEKKVKISPDWLRVSLSYLGMEDAQMLLLADYLDERLQDAEAAQATEEDPQAPWCHLELDQNQFGDEGVVAVLDVLEAHHVSCRMIKLYKNNLTDIGGVRLAEMISRQKYPAEEIHLSHNGFTARTLVAMCMAMELNDTYPLVNEKQKFSPCWVRIERNSIASPLEVVDMLEKEGYCSTCSATKRGSCGPGRCELSSKEWQSTPPVHLYMLHKQGDKNALDDESRAELRSEIHRWRARAISKDPVQSFTSSGGARGSAPSRRVEEASSTTSFDHENQTQMGKDELLKWFSVVDEDGVPEDLHVSARNPEELHVGDYLEPMEQEKIIPENDTFSRLLAAATQNPRWKRDQEEARRRQVETALEIVTACLPPDDTEVFGRWKKHIEEAFEPELEANRIFRMMTKLHSLGYPGPARRTPIATPIGSRSSSPFAHPNLPSSHSRSLAYAPSTVQSETVGSLAKRAAVAAAGNHSFFSNGQFNTTPLLNPVTSPPSGVEMSSSPEPEDSSTWFSNGKDRSRQDPHLLGLLTKLQQSTTPTANITSVSSFPAAAEECRNEGEMEKKKKGKNKMTSSLSRTERGDPATEGLPSALDREDLIPATTLSHTREGECTEPESSWLDVEAVESTDLLRRLVEQEPKSGTEIQSSF